MASYSVEDMRRRAKLVEYLDMPDERFLLLSKDTQNSLVINLLKVKVEDLSKENSERVASLKLKTLYDYTRHSWINIKSETFVPDVLSGSVVCDICFGCDKKAGGTLLLKGQVLERHGGTAAHKANVEKARADRRGAEKRSTSGASAAAAAGADAASGAASSSAGAGAASARGSAAAATAAAATTGTLQITRHHFNHLRDAVRYRTFPSSCVALRLTSSQACAVPAVWGSSASAEPLARRSCRR